MININIRKILSTLLPLVGIFSFSIANATPIITFDDINADTSGGSFSYVPSDGKLKGENIFFNTLTGLDTLTNSGELLSVSGTLSFESGMLTNNNGSSLTFASGGLISMKGDVTIGGQTYTGTIFEGSFTEGAILDYSPSFATARIIEADVEILNSELLAFFDLDPQIFRLTGSISTILPDFESDGSINSTSFSVNSDLTLVATQVPSTGSTMTMLSIGLTILSLVARRNK